VPTLLLIVRISVGSKKLTWPIVIGPSNALSINQLVGYENKQLTSKMSRRLSIILEESI
jgi:hypothetical protein